MCLLLGSPSWRERSRAPMIVRDRGAFFMRPNTMMFVICRITVAELVPPSRKCLRLRVCVCVCVCACVCSVSRQPTWAPRMIPTWPQQKERPFWGWPWRKWGRILVANLGTSLGSLFWTQSWGSRFGLGLGPIVLNPKLGNNILGFALGQN